ncbi:hypothetical protein, partial [Nocardia jiangsuensis]
ASHPLHYTPPAEKRNRVRIRQDAGLQPEFLNGAGIAFRPARTALRLFGRRLPTAQRPRLSGKG